MTEKDNRQVNTLKLLKTGGNSQLDSKTGEDQKVQPRPVATRVIDGKEWKDADSLFNYNPEEDKEGSIHPYGQKR